MMAGLLAANDKRGSLSGSSFCSNDWYNLTSSKPPNPYIVIIGNVSQIHNFVSGPPLLIGNYTNVHYQSLLPITSDVGFDEVNLTTLTIYNTKTNNEGRELKPKVEKLT